MECVGRVEALTGALKAYREARLDLLRTIGTPTSNREPLSEFAEQLVAGALGGTCALSRVQADWDVVLPSGARVQVKYLANVKTPDDRAWINEHVVRWIAGVDWWAVVVIEDFTVVGIPMFPCTNLAPIAAALGKRHGNTDRELQFGHSNWCAIRDDPDRYRGLGMRVLLPIPAA